MAGWCVGKQSSRKVTFVSPQEGFLLDPSFFFTSLGFSFPPPKVSSVILAICLFSCHTCLLSFQAAGMRQKDSKRRAGRWGWWREDRKQSRLQLAGSTVCVVERIWMQRKCSHPDGFPEQTEQCQAQLEEEVSLILSKPLADKFNTKMSQWCVGCHLLQPTNYRLNHRTWTKVHRTGIINHNWSCLLA